MGKMGSMGKMKMMNVSSPPQKTKMIFSNSNRKKKEKKKKKYVYKEETEYELEDEKSDQNVVMFNKLTEIFSKIYSLQEKENLNSVESKNLTLHVEELESHLKKMQKIYDVVSQIDSSFKIKSRINQMNCSSFDFSVIEKISSNFQISEKQKQLLQSWKQNLSIGNSNHIEPPNNSCDKANFENYGEEDSISRGIY